MKRPVLSQFSNLFSREGCLVNKLFSNRIITKVLVIFIEKKKVYSLVRAIAQVYNIAIL